jgi:histidine triad (HIT) family protein
MDEGSAGGGELLNESVPPEACIFCKIVNGEAPAHRVHEDERTLIFMDVEEPDLASVIVQSRRLARAIRTVLEPDGIGVFQLNGAAAGQTVFHYHMHLIPRMRGDVLQVHSRTPGDPERLADTARRLAAAMGSG